jgi:LuxR family glucitol operon transcriptional activator
MEVLTKEISAYLAAFRVLVVIDNLETISAEDVIMFLRDLPTGSKVLITSRIGLGQLEHAYPLYPMDEKDATHFFRRAAAIQNVTELRKAKADVVDRWCKRLSYSPLAIKWFVAAVALGKDPDGLTRRKSRDYQELLQFSFKNLFDSLTAVGRLVVHIVHAAGSALTKTQLLILAEALSPKTPADELETALRTLINASVLRIRVANEPGDPSRYELGAFAQQFLIAVVPPDRGLVTAVQAQMKQLRASREESDRLVQYYRYDQYAIHCRHHDERLVGARLRQALDLSRREGTAEALAMVETAARILPQFSEVHRVKGMVLRDAGDLIGAKEEFEICLELDSSSQIGRYTLGQFLLHHIGDFDGACQVAESLVKDDPREPAPMSLLALALQRCGRLRESSEFYETLLGSLDMAKHRVRVAIRDQAAETYRRMCELDSRSKERGLFRTHLVRGLEILIDSLEDDRADARTKARLDRIVDEGLREALRTRDAKLADDVAAVLLRVPEALPPRISVAFAPPELVALCNSGACVELAARLCRVLTTRLGGGQGQQEVTRVQGGKAAQG